MWEVYGLMMAHTIGCIVDGDIDCCLIDDTFHIEPDPRRLHKLLSPQIWCQLAGWILSYGQKPLAIPSRKVPWFGGSVVCCQKSLDVEVPKRAISQVHEKIFSATYIQPMPRAVQQAEDGGENVL